jgi:beta-glucosidase
MEAWYPGEQGGNAIAGILTGKVNPSGRLPVTFPQSVGHVPVFYNHKPTGRGDSRRGGSPENPGTSYVFSTTDPLYPFGFGLSYTQFEYSGLKISRRELSGTDTVKCSLNVRNTGKFAGKEVIQIYVNDKVSSVTTPVKVLKAFKKIAIAPGKTAALDFSVPCNELGLWDVNMNYVVEPGEYEIMAGASAEDIRLRDSVIIK